MTTARSWSSTTRSASSAATTWAPPTPPSGATPRPDHRPGRGPQAGLRRLLEPPPPRRARPPPAAARDRVGLGTPDPGAPPRAQLWMFPIRAMYLEAIARVQPHLHDARPYFIPTPTSSRASPPPRAAVDVRLLVPATSNHVVADWLARLLRTTAVERGADLPLPGGDGAQEPPRSTAAGPPSAPRTSTG